MKKILITIMTAFLLITSCEDVLEEEWKNPMVYSPAVEEVAPGMFTSMITQWKFYIKDYGEWWWQNSGYGILSYMQLTCRYITPRYGWFIDYDDMEYIEPDAGFSWFNDYYVRMRNWAAIKSTIADLEGAEYDDNVIYFKLATVVKDWGALRNVDIYNKIPYFDAYKGTEGVFFVPYDDPAEIYKAVLDELKEIKDELPGIYAKMSTEAKAKFEEQDLALIGNVDDWVTYINALRLRYAVKLSGIDAAFASAHITDAITNLPAKDLTWDIPHVDAAASLPGGGTWERGCYERAYAMLISNVILNRMNFVDSTYQEGIDDPRLPVLALPTKYNDYRGVSYNADAEEPIYNGGDTYYPYCDNIVASSQNNGKSMWSHVTYAHNNQPADMFTLGEVDLLLAEVALKTLASTGKTAGEHIRDAINHSTDFWYEMNGLSSYGMDVSEPWLSLIHPAKPDASVIDGYAANVKTVFNAAATEDDKMEILMIQKYIHINLLRPYLLWSELRRTRHPKIEKMTFTGKVMDPQLERIKYPSSEFASNTDNYMTVVDEDNYTSQIFWIPDNLKNVSFYRDDYVTFKTGTMPDFN